VFVVVVLLFVGLCFLKMSGCMLVVFVDVVDGLVIDVLDVVDIVGIVGIVVMGAMLDFWVVCVGDFYVVLFGLCAYGV